MIWTCFYISIWNQDIQVNPAGDWENHGESTWGESEFQFSLLCAALPKLKHLQTVVLTHLELLLWGSILLGSPLQLWGSASHETKGNSKFLTGGHCHSCGLAVTNRGDGYKPLFTSSHLTQLLSEITEGLIATRQLHFSVGQNQRPQKFL